MLNSTMNRHIDQSDPRLPDLGGQLIDLREQIGRDGQRGAIRVFPCLLKYSVNDLLESSVIVTPSRTA